jgi:hypothetical protein
LPDLFIQDLGRSVSYLLADGGTIKSYEGFLEDAGWRFYEEILHAKFYHWHSGIKKKEIKAKIMEFAKYFLISFCSELSV